MEAKHLNPLGLKRALKPLISVYPKLDMLWEFKESGKSEILEALDKGSTALGIQGRFLLEKQAPVVS